MERRTLTSTTSLNSYLDWAGVQQVCRVERQRTIGNETTVEVCYFITSLDRDSANAEQLLALCRNHWGAIENGLHNVRDEALAEDRCTIFRCHAAQNLAAMRNAALNWLRRRDIQKIAPTLRSFTRNPQRLFTKLGYQN